LAAQREAAEKELEEIVKASKTREELEAESLRKRLEQLREFLSLRIIDEQRYYELSHELAMRAFEKGVGKPEEDKEEERRREQLERDLEQIREFVMTREEVELEAHRQRLERLRELLEAGRIQEEEFYE